MERILPGPIAIEIAEKFDRVIEIGVFKKLDLALAIQQGINNSNAELLEALRMCLRYTAEIHKETKNKIRVMNMEKMIGDAIAKVEGK